MAGKTAISIMRQRLLHNCRIKRRTGWSHTSPRERRELKNPFISCAPIMNLPTPVGWVTDEFLNVVSKVSKLYGCFYLVPWYTPILPPWVLPAVHNEDVAVLCNAYES